MQRHPNLHLSDQLCFALYSATNAMLRAYRRRLGAIGLTYTQFLVLLALWEEDGVPLKSLASRLGLDSASLTPVIKRLEKLGLLRRDRSEIDERRICIVLTEGAMALQDTAAEIQDVVRRQTGLSDMALGDLRALLQNVTATLALHHDDQPAADPADDPAPTHLDR